MIILTRDESPLVYRALVVSEDSILQLRTLNCPISCSYVQAGRTESRYKRQFGSNSLQFRKVKEIGDKQNLQDDIDKLVKWSEKWQMLFNFGKCKCLHIGSGNTGMNYEMGGTILSKTVKEKDLGVTMNANMKVSE